MALCIVGRWPNECHCVSPLVRPPEHPENGHEPREIDDITPMHAEKAIGIKPTSEVAHRREAAAHRR
jgi:hypothetical protein